MSYNDKFWKTDEEREMVERIKKLSDLEVRKALLYMVGYQDMIINLDNAINYAQENEEVDL